MKFLVAAILGVITDLVIAFPIVFFWASIGEIWRVNDIPVRELDFGGAYWTVVLFLFIVHTVVFGVSVTRELLKAAVDG